MSWVMASLTPLRYPMPNPTAQPPAAQPKIRRHIRATSIAHTTEASAERSQLIYLERTDPTTNRRASRAGGPDAVPRRTPALQAQKTAAG